MVLGVRPNLTFNANDRPAAELYLRVLRRCIGSRSAILSVNYNDNVLSVTTLLLNTGDTFNASVSRLTIGATVRGTGGGNFRLPIFATRGNSLSRYTDNACGVVVTGVITSIIVGLGGSTNGFLSGRNICVANKVVSDHGTRIRRSLRRGNFSVVRAHSRGN